MEPEQQSRLLAFFAVMGDAQRLQLIAKLMDQWQTRASLQAALALDDETLRQHIEALNDLDLLSFEKRDGEFYYQFNSKALDQLNRDILYKAQAPTPVDGLDDDEAKQILRHFFEGQRLIAIPEQPKKFSLLVEWLLSHFETGVRYSEKQVNAILTQYHEDYATFRRAMVEMGMMQRDHGVYWREESYNARF